MLRYICIVICIIGMNSSAFASTPEAWDNFRNEVAVSCANNINNLLVDYVISVDPNGSQSYEIAIAEGKVKRDAGRARYICVFDKRSKRVEVSSSSEFDFQVMDIKSDNLNPDKKR